MSCCGLTFRPYLYGRAFMLITDHFALKWLKTRTNLAGRLRRWSPVLQEYEFQVEYRPGVTNVVAYALSRAPAVVRMVYQHVSKTIDAAVETTTITATGGMVNTLRLGDGQDAEVATAGPTVIEVATMKPTARTAPTETTRTNVATVGETPTAEDAASVVMASVATVRE
ncbi:hypothetical protein PHMEG_00017408 [Phytophthora megakarya]|uniref:Reverse transcriptase RNase H-like domain-containing protein n=1 Tax=Phytophthora megakarya TaxID=4795 RepID=A0A225VYH0_9STRA|nr:hypothetical protein PHMEG_00017408 [Phytophthora megakarya]